MYMHTIKVYYKQLFTVDMTMGPHIAVSINWESIKGSYKVSYILLVGAASREVLCSLDSKTFQYPEGATTSTGRISAAQRSTYPTKSIASRCRCGAKASTQ